MGQFLKKKFRQERQDFAGVTRFLVFLVLLLWFLSLFGKNGEREWDVGQFLEKNFFRQD